MDVAIAVHGGAGDFEMKKDEQQKVETLSQKGIRMLREDENAENVVEKVVKELESDSRFNAGIGSKIQLDGTPRPEAGFMNSKREIGCAIGLEKIENPVSVAKYIMENLNNNIVSSPYVNELARECGFNKTKLITEDRKQELEEIKNYLPNKSIRKQLEHIEERHSGGTVGCVALDSNGELCSATSTGG
jgi:beta-aspartyl-peptidase (threonine type)